MMQNLLAHFVVGFHQKLDTKIATERCKSLEEKRSRCKENKKSLPVVKVEEVAFVIVASSVEVAFAVSTELAGLVESVCVIEYQMVMEAVGKKVFVVAAAIRAISDVVAAAQIV